MQVNPHLSFNGQCEEAFQFYAACLGGQIVTMMKYGDTPMADHMPPDWRGKVAHAMLELRDTRLTAADPPPEHYQKPQGAAVLLNVDSVEEAERVFNALAESAVVQHPLKQTFWARRFGMLTDRFGTPWLVNCGNTG